MLDATTPGNCRGGLGKDLRMVWDSKCTASLIIFRSQHLKSCLSPHHEVVRIPVLNLKEVPDTQHVHMHTRERETEKERVQSKQRSMSWLNLITSHGISLRQKQAHVHGYYGNLSCPPPNIPGADLKDKCSQNRSVRMQIYSVD